MNRHAEHRQDDEEKTEGDDDDALTGDADEYSHMSADDFEEFLVDAISEFANENAISQTSVQTFCEAGLLTNNRGVVVRVGRGQFQVTIVRSR